MSWAVCCAVSRSPPCSKTTQTAAEPAPKNLESDTVACHLSCPRCQAAARILRGLECALRLQVSRADLHVTLSLVVCCSVSKLSPRFRTMQSVATPEREFATACARASCLLRHAAAMALRLQAFSAGLHTVLNLAVCCSVPKLPPCFKTVQRAAVPALMRPENGARDGRGQGFRLTLVLEPICAHARARVRVHTCA